LGSPKDARQVTGNGTEPEFGIAPHKAIAPDKDAGRERRIELSDRQKECLSRIASGQTSSEIAKAIGLSPRTVDHYVADACRKLGVRRRVQAIVKATALDLF